MLTLALTLALSFTSADDLAWLAGQWSGTLTYLDYKDNKTRVTLKTTMECRKTPEGLRYRFDYVEPNGKAVAGDETSVTLDSARQRITVGRDEWTVVGTPGAGRLTIELDGTDAGRAVRFSRTYTLSGDELRIETSARPTDGGTSLVRNTYVLRRIQ